jgi:hypothetical protein
MTQPETHRFEDAGGFTNSRLPVLLYHDVGDACGRRVYLETALLRCPVWHGTPSRAQTGSTLGATSRAAFRGNACRSVVLLSVARTPTAGGGVRQRSRIRFTSDRTRSRACARLAPAISSSSYGVSSWRTAAAASSIAPESRARPAAVRPTRPLPRVPVWCATASARSVGQPGNSRAISREISSCSFRSLASRCTSSRAGAARSASWPG